MVRTSSHQEKVRKIRLPGLFSGGNKANLISRLSASSTAGEAFIVVVVVLANLTTGVYSGGGNGGCLFTN